MTTCVMRNPVSAKTCLRRGTPHSLLKGGNVLVIDEVQPLGKVKDNEGPSARHGGEDPAGGGLAVAVIHGVHGHDHRQAAGEQAECHDCGENDAGRKWNGVGQLGVDRRAYV